MTWIKICGITNKVDAQWAVSLGADALGFIFANSQRQIEPDTAKEIIDCLPKQIEKIGVFIDQDAKVVKEIAEYCGLTGLQFHGTESPVYCKKFINYQVIKAFRVNSERGWDNIISYTEDSSVNRILFDTYVQGVPGGTGKTFPWSLVTSKKIPNHVPIIIAGGLNPTNVGGAILQAKPFGIDVGSGVEREPGKKDIEKLKNLLKSVKNIENKKLSIVEVEYDE